MNNYLNSNCDSSCGERRLIGSRCCGLDGTICFFVILIALALGLILGAVFYATILPVLASVIAFGAALLAAAIALIVYRFRRCR